MSLERMALPRGIVALRAVPPASAHPGEAPAQQGCIPMPPLELKEMQRRAYERGKACEHDAVAQQLGGLLASLAESAQALDAVRQEEKQQLARFGVEVAMAIAGHLVGSTVGSGSHDVRALVESLLEEALPGISHGAVQVAVNPADLDALAGFSGSGAPPSVAGRVQFVADPALPPATCRIRAGGAEILADPKMRLAAIAERLRSLAAAEVSRA